MIFYWYFLGYINISFDIYWILLIFPTIYWRFYWYFLGYTDDFTDISFYITWILLIFPWLYWYFLDSPDISMDILTILLKFRMSSLKGSPGQHRSEQMERQSQSNFCSDIIYDSASPHSVPHLGGSCANARLVWFPCKKVVDSVHSSSNNSASNDYWVKLLWLYLSILCDLANQQLKSAELSLLDTSFKLQDTKWPPTIKCNRLRYMINIFFSARWNWMTTSVRQKLNSWQGRNIFC